MVFRTSVFVLTMCAAWYAGFFFFISPLFPFPFSLFFVLFSFLFLFCYINMYFFLGGAHFYTSKIRQNCVIAWMLTTWFDVLLFFLYSDQVNEGGCHCPKSCNWCGFVRAKRRCNCTDGDLWFVKCTNLFPCGRRHVYPLWTCSTFTSLEHFFVRKYFLGREGFFH